MESKKWYESYTVWFNVALLVVDFINSLTQFIPIPAGVLTYVTLAGNLLLRFKTTTAIK